jgi:hypothetical protein
MQAVTIVPYARATFQNYHFLKRLFYFFSSIRRSGTKGTTVTKQNNCITLVKHGLKKDVFILMFLLTRATSVLQ